MTMASDRPAVGVMGGALAALGLAAPFPVLIPLYWGLAFLGLVLGANRVGRVVGLATFTAALVSGLTFAGFGFTGFGAAGYAGSLGAFGTMLAMASGPFAFCVYAACAHRGWIRGCAVGSVAAGVMGLAALVWGGGEGVIGLGLLVLVLGSVAAFGGLARSALAPEAAYP